MKAAPLLKLKDINSVDVYASLMGEPILLKKKYHSPFKEDLSPSLSFFIKNGQLLWNDFTFGGDVVSFVERFLDITRYEAYDYIRDNFEHKQAIPVEKRIGSKPETTLVVNKADDFTPEVLEYFEQASIEKHHLIKLATYSVHSYEVNGRFFPANPLTVVYETQDLKDNKIYSKVYDIQNKLFVSNFKGNTDRLLDLFLRKGSKDMVLVNSRKDLYAIMANTSYSICGLQNESTLPNKEIIETLQSRYNLLYIADKDPSGLLFAKKLKEALNIDHQKMALGKDPFEHFKITKNNGGNSQKTH